AGSVSVLAWIRAAEEGLAVDDDRLAAAEAEGVRVPDDFVSEPLELVRLTPQALFEADELAVDPETRLIERRLRVERLVDEGGDELDVRLRLDEASHDAERADELAVLQD